MDRDKGIPGTVTGVAGVALALVSAAALAVLVSCTSSPKPMKPFVHTTKAFDAVFGELPPMTVPGPCYATVVYFPSAKTPGKYLPVPIFSTEQGKEETLAVRTVIRGIDQEEFAKEVVFPFPKGADLLSFGYEGARAMIRVGGTFKAAALSQKEREIAARSVALTVAQFGRATKVDITDAEGKVHLIGQSEGVETADPGNPKALGLLAIREDEGKPATTLSLLFDRPVFVDEIAFFPPGGDSPTPGKSYATGFGMSVELHPDPGIIFGAKDAYRIRFKVRDGKGRTTAGEERWVPKEIVRI
ncbi:MAG: GerMN domain-containing protein [Actinomycetota bacterium]